MAACTTMIDRGEVRWDPPPANRVRVSAELVDASTQQTLWSDRYDRDLADVLTVQSQIAQQIAHALQANLSPAEQRQIEKRPTSNLDAVFNLRADAEVRVLLEEAERTAPYHSRIQRLSAWLDVFEGRIERAVQRADELITRFPTSEEVKFFGAELRFYSTRRTWRGGSNR